MPNPIVEAHGIHVDVPPGWNAEIFRFGDGSPADGTEPRHMTEEEVRNSPPLMHAATVDLPPNRGTYAVGVIDHLGPGDAFVALIDHGEDEASAPVFALPNAPWPLRPDDFDPAEGPVGAPEIAYVQRFFQQSGRALVLFAGIHEGNGRSLPVGQINRLLAGLRVTGRP
jgi:hypothetical protein